MTINEKVRYEKTQLSRKEQNMKLIDKQHKY